MENLYHQTQVREAEGIKLFTRLFESAKRFSHYDFCSELLSTLDEIHLARPTSQQWVDFYKGKMSRLADSSAWEQAHAINRRLYALPDLEPALRARVANDLGRYYYHISCQYLEAVAALEEALAAGDLRAVEREAHGLKSGSTNIRADHFGKLLEEVEQAGKAGLEADVRAAFPDLRAAFRQVLHFLNEHGSSSV